MPIDFWDVAVPFTWCHYKGALFQNQMKMQWWISTYSLWNLNLGVAEAQCSHSVLCAKWIVICSGLTYLPDSQFCSIFANVALFAKPFTINVKILMKCFTSCQISVGKAFKCVSIYTCLILPSVHNEILLNNVLYFLFPFFGMCFEK